MIKLSERDISTMPIKETPWGSMKQNRAAMNCEEDSKRPPKPGFLPPAPPPCSISPIPSVNGLTDNGGCTNVPPKPGFLPPAPPPCSISPLPSSVQGLKDDGGCTSVVYDRVITPVEPPSSCALPTTNGNDNITLLSSSNNCGETNSINHNLNIHVDEQVIFDTSSNVPSNSYDIEPESNDLDISNQKEVVDCEIRVGEDDDDDANEIEDESEGSYEYYDTSSEEEDENDDADESDEHEKELEKALDTDEGNKFNITAQDELEEEYEDDDGDASNFDDGKLLFPFTVKHNKSCSENISIER